MPSRRLPLLAVLLVCAACSSSGQTVAEKPHLPPGRAIDTHPTLTPFSGCGDLEQRLEDGMVLRMRSSLEEIRIWGWTFAAGDGRAVPPAPQGDGAGGPTSFTSTNVQVEGVAEADIVQNDGTRIAALAGGALHLLRSWPAASLEEASSVAIEGWPQGLYLTGDQAVVMSSVYVPRPVEDPEGACIAPGPVGAPSAVYCGYTVHDVVKVTTLDVSSLSAPRVVAETYLPGTYLGSRRVGQRIRLVMSDTLVYPDGVRFWPELAPGATREQIDAAFAALADANEQLIRARSLDEWLRRGTVKRPGQPDEDVGYACTDFAGPSGPSLPGLVTVATLDLDSQRVVGRTSIFAEAGTIYASQGTLYVVSSHWWWWPEPGQTSASYVHAFDLSDPDQAAYAGSGVVDGTVRDPFALDEHEGALRVATATATRVADGTPWGGLESAARVSVLRLSDGELRVVGETPKFGAGEQVFGTRFVGTRGFVITARRIDPLFGIDVSDPTAPAVVGQLEMPGFISYLHPIDATHLLGVGQQRDSATDPLRVKIALLDVSDLAHPRDVSTVLVGEGSSTSDATWDAKAFTWFPEKKLLAVPFADWAEAGFRSDLRLFRVAETGITPAGRLPMDDVYSSQDFAWYWWPYARRGILASDDTGEYVYGVSDAGIRSARVAELPAWLATVRFPPLVGSW